MKINLSMLMIVCMLFCGSITAQTKVTGTVKGNDGMPLPSVSVVVKVLHEVYLPILMGSMKFRYKLMKYLNLAHWVMLHNKRRWQVTKVAWC